MKEIFINIIIGILFLLFFISLGLIIVINFEGLYIFDINLLKIPESSGMNYDEILKNYKTLIEYCSPFFKGELVFPTLSSSKEGLQHFVEVKRIFTVFYYLLPITFVMLLISIIYKKKRKDYKYLFKSAIICIFLPITVIVSMLVNFDDFFIIFHKMFFRNDFWLFDRETDPIINILPDTYFMHCAFFIAGVIIIGSISLIIIYFILKKHKYY